MADGLTTAQKAERLTEEIAAALRERPVDLELVRALLLVLAVTDPHRAQEVYDTIQAGLKIRGRADA